MGTLWITEMNFLVKIVLSVHEPMGLQFLNLGISVQKIIRTHSFIFAVSCIKLLLSLTATHT
jgi:hypothetical protein